MAITLSGRDGSAFCRRILRWVRSAGGATTWGAVRWLLSCVLKRAYAVAESTPDVLYLWAINDDGGVKVQCWHRDIGS